MSEHGWKELEAEIAAAVSAKLPAPTCCNQLGRTPDGDFCTCEVGQLARELADRQAREKPNA